MILQNYKKDHPLNIYPNNPYIAQEEPLQKALPSSTIVDNKHLL